MRTVFIISLFLHLFVSCLLRHIYTVHSQVSNITSCNTSSNFTIGSAYETNRDLTLDLLVGNASASGFNGFAILSVGDSPNSVYGLVRCRAYVSEAECQTCANASANELSQRCSNQKGASGLYEHCSLKYYDSQLLLNSDGGYALSWMSLKNANNPGKFKSALGNLMRELFLKASSSPFKLAMASAAFSDFNSIYGMVQCIEALSADSCSMCLQTIISMVQGFCPGKDGCRVMSQNCDLRYETYPFALTYAQSPPPSPPIIPSSPPPSPPVIPSSPLPPWPNTITIHPSSKSIVPVMAISVVGAVAVISTTFSCGFWVWRRKHKKETLSNCPHIPTTLVCCDAEDHDDGGSTDQRTKPLLISLRTLRTATGNFSYVNKLGEGGFGPVYKGRLSDGKQIAVKRLSSNSCQGIEEMKTEVLLVAKLLHRNLVRLIGFCLEEEEKLLIYEFLPNGSLDKILFDQLRRIGLSWEKRYAIISGVARGLLYLHEDSQLRIIHRDLKASNILLDQDMNPKISDFGLAKLFAGSQTQGNTLRIAGTYGYMAPEYVVRGHFSTKSDVYSFGILVLEIISGRKNSSFGSSTNLPSHAWQHWANGTALELSDPSLGEQCPRFEVLKCIQIGLLCTQDTASDRPTMSEVVVMLGSYSVTNLTPSRPAFFYQSKEGSGGSQSDQRKQSSVNEVTISELDPR